MLKITQFKIDKLQIAYQKYLRNLSFLAVLQGEIVLSKVFQALAFKWWITIKLKTEFLTVDLLHRQKSTNTHSNPNQKQKQKYSQIKEYKERFQWKLRYTKLL